MQFQVELISLPKSSTIVKTKVLELPTFLGLENKM